MKIRADFITNSSSSAFVVIGTKFDEEDYDRLWKISDENDLYFFSEEGIIGKIIADLDYESYKVRSMTFSEIQKEFEDMKKLFKELGIEGEIKLIADIFAT